jgi:acetyl-CoA synthetase
MSKNIINKISSNSRDKNFHDYQQSCDDFNGQTALKNILNIAYQAVDKHLNTSIENKLALRWLGKDQQVIDYSYRDLAEQTSLFASVLAKLGFEPGVRVFSLVGRLPLLYISALGTLKFGGVFTPLFSAFGPEPIRSRMQIGEANILVTTKRLYDKKIATWWHELPHLKVILFIDSPEHDSISAPSSHTLDKGCYPPVSGLLSPQLIL